MQGIIVGSNSSWKRKWSHVLPEQMGVGFLEDNEVLLVNLFGHYGQSLLEDEDIMN